MIRPLPPRPSDPFSSLSRYSLSSDTSTELLLQIVVSRRAEGRARRTPPCRRRRPLYFPTN